MKTIIVDEQYLTTVTIYKDYIKDLPEDEQLIARLRGINHNSISSVDHPEFDKVRRELEEEGYLEVRRNCWNADSVIKPFIFNGEEFKKGEMFPCASAMKGHLTFIKRQYARSNIKKLHR